MTGESSAAGERGEGAPAVESAPAVKRALAGTESHEAAHELEKTRRNFVLGLLAAFAILSFLVFRPFISYLFMGFLLVYLLTPVYNRVLLGVKRPSIASAAVLLLALLLVVGPLVWVGFEVAETARAFTGNGGDLQEQIVGAVNVLVERFGGLVGMEPGAAGGPSAGETFLANAAASLESWVNARLGSALAFAGSVTVGLVVMLFVLYYGLKDGPSLVHFIVDMSPLDDDMDRELISEVRKTVDAVFLGHIIVSAIQGIIGGIGFLIFGVPNAVFWGFVMIVMSLIPMIGAFVIWAPAAAWLLATGQTVQGIGLILWGALLVSTIDNVLRPKIVGTRADIHPVLVLVGVLGGLTAFGFIGFVLGPLVLAMFVAVVNFWRSDFLPQYRARRAGEADIPPGPGGAGGLDVPDDDDGTTPASRAV